MTMQFLTTRKHFRRSVCLSKEERCISPPWRTTLQDARPSASRVCSLSMGNYEREGSTTEGKGSECLPPKNLWSEGTLINRSTGSHQ